MIVLGNGVFSIGTTDIALTRGGGQFVVEREYRDIEADGDKGPVKGRTVINKSVPKLTMNALSIIPADYGTYYPGITVTDDVSNTVITGSGDIQDADYQTVKWTGKTKEGKAVIITLNNAINLENFDWNLADKDEVIHALTYTGTYTEGSDVEPWNVDFVK
ncbi:hypothetical protein [Romboutsia sp.]|uniref:hypothetical protein n=1 Tax=Romboutsia sp. TaxID=1965302 RepID=UPI002CF23BC0|nr:hypothetical protein [Romboutsia sp.]HSQ88098.1 hypothetical protein [Romboutsia sp.]